MHSEIIKGKSEKSAKKTKPFKGEPLSISVTCPDQHILAKCFCTGARPVMCLC